MGWPPATSVDVPAGPRHRCSLQALHALHARPDRTILTVGPMLVQPYARTPVYRLWVVSGDGAIFVFLRGVSAIVARFLRNLRRISDDPTSRARNPIAPCPSAVMSCNRM